MFILLISIDFVIDVFRCGAKKGNPYCENLFKPKQRILIEPLPNIQPLKTEQKHALNQFMLQLLDLNWIDIGFKRIQEALGVKLFPTY